MKKLWIFIMLLMISPFFSCDDDSDENQFNPALLLLLGSNSLTVNVTYTGTYELHTTEPGGGYVWAYLYSSKPASTRNPVAVYTASTGARVTNANVQTITLKNLAEGSYYLMVFYDYRSGDNTDNRGDLYTLYDATSDGTSCPAIWIPINIPATTTVDINLDGSDDFPAGAGSGLGATFDLVECPS